MKDASPVILNQETLAQLRRKGFGRFALVAEDLASEAALICGSAVVTQRDEPLVSHSNPLPAYSIEWTEKYVSALGPKETKSHSIHKTPEAAIIHLKEEFEKRKRPFPDKGWDLPITIYAIEITNDGVLAKTLATQDTVSDADYFVRDAAGRRLYDFEEEHERYFDLLSDIRKLQPTNWRIEFDIHAGLVHTVRRRFGWDFRKKCTFS